MEDKNNESSDISRVSSGPLRMYKEDEKIFVTGFGLWIEVRTEEEADLLIRELENEGFHICY